MSGIAGVWHLDGRPVSPDELNGMAERLAHRGGDARGVWLGGDVGLACELRRVTPESLQESQPARHPAGHAIVFDGRLDCRKELLSVLPAGRSLEGAPDPELLLAAYEELGERLFAHLNGDFAFALFDARQRKLYLVRDPMGVRPLYYHRAGDTFLFASEVKAFLDHPKFDARPNDRDLADLLLATSPLQNRYLTCFEGVEAVSPSHFVRVSPASIESRQYWDFDVGRRIRYRSIEEYAEEFRERFFAAVCRRLRSAWPVAIQVSGGLDSSGILCAIEYIRRSTPSALPPTPAFTFQGIAGTPSDEIRYVEAIERKYGISVHRVPSSIGIFTGSRDSVRAFEEQLYHIESPYPNDLVTMDTSLRRAVRAQGARVLLSGHWGDQFLFAQDYLVDLIHRFRWIRAFSHLQEYPRWFTDASPDAYRQRFRLDLIKYHAPQSLLPLLRKARKALGGLNRDCPWYGDRLRELARRSDYRPPRARSQFATVHAVGMYAEARARYHVLNLEWNDKMAALYGAEAGFPYMDRDLLAFLMNAPGEVLTWRGVPKGLLRIALRDAMPEEVGQRRWKADFSGVVKCGIRSDYPLLLEQLDRCSVAATRGYVNEPGLRSELAGMENLPGSDAERMYSRVINMIGFCLWMEIFFGELRPAPGRLETVRAGGS